MIIGVFVEVKVKIGEGAGSEFRLFGFRSGRLNRFRLGGINRGDRLGGDRLTRRIDRRFGLPAIGRLVGRLRDGSAGLLAARFATAQIVAGVVVAVSALVCPSVPAVVIAVIVTIFIAVIVTVVITVIVAIVIAVVITVVITVVVTVVVTIITSVSVEPASGISPVIASVLAPVITVSAVRLLWRIGGILRRIRRVLLWVLGILSVHRHRHGHRHGVGDRYGLDRHIASGLILSVSRNDHRVGHHLVDRRHGI